MLGHRTMGRAIQSNNARISSFITYGIRLLFFILFYIVFSILYIISITIDYMHQLCFLDMLNYPVIYLRSERESDSKHAMNSVYLSNEIVSKVPNYHFNKFLSASAWSTLSSLLISAERTA